jgi:class 3 adenylate cyclase
LAWAAALVGRLTEAQQLAEPFGESGEVPVRLVALSALAEVADRTGRDDEARRYAEVAWELASLTGESQRIVPAAAALARIALRTPGRPVSESGPRFWDALRHTTDDLGFGSHWMFSPEYAWALAATGENADVTELNRWVAAVDALTAKDDSESNTAASLLCRASQERIANELAQCADDLTAALKLFEAMPYPARQVETLIELARAEAALGRDEDAIATARRAHGRARDLGALRLVDAASDLVDALRGGTVVATVLFTDIVGSTEQAAAMGDLAWSNLLNEHNQVVRSSLARFGGREIDNAGDGFLSAFDSPTRAIRCSSAILAGLQAVGIRARAALHTGECRQVGSKLTGLAVHVAARVLALADAGDILVSGTVRDLLVGSDIEFDDRGAHVLRGVPGEWRVFSVAG